MSYGMIIAYIINFVKVVYMRLLLLDTDGVN